MLDAALTIKLKRKRRNYVFRRHDGNVSFVKLREKKEKETLS